MFHIKKKLLYCMYICKRTINFRQYWTFRTIRCYSWSNKIGWPVLKTRTCLETVLCINWYFRNKSLVFLHIKPPLDSLFGKLLDALRHTTVFRRKTYFGHDTINFNFHLFQIFFWQFGFCVPKLIKNDILKKPHFFPKIESFFSNFPSFK